jgi:hypothetical protein
LEPPDRTVVSDWTITVARSCPTSSSIKRYYFGGTPVQLHHCANLGAWKVSAEVYGRYDSTCLTSQKKNGTACRNNDSTSLEARRAGNLVTTQPGDSNGVTGRSIWLPFVVLLPAGSLTFFSGFRSDGRHAMPSVVAPTNESGRQPDLHLVVSNKEYFHAWRQACPLLTSRRPRTTSYTSKTSPETRGAPSHGSHISTLSFDMARYKNKPSLWRELVSSSLDRTSSGKWYVGACSLHNNRVCGKFG